MEMPPLADIGPDDDDSVTDKGTIYTLFHMSQNDWHHPQGQVQGPSE